MFCALQADQYERVRPVLNGMTHNLIAVSVVDGICPGRIWADDAEMLRTAVISTPQGYFLVGQKPDGEARVSLKALLAEQIFPEEQRGGSGHFCLHYVDRSWEPTIGYLLETKHPVLDNQQYFVLENLKTDWRSLLSAGFSVKQIDEDLLGQAELNNINQLRGWADGNFRSIAQFLERGIGFCLMRGNEPVSWCMSTCVSGSRCELGAHTDWGYRRRGFARCTTAAAVECCLSRGLTEVGWHCWSSNLASAATARAVGFRKVFDHPAVRVWFSELDSLLAKGNLCLLRGEYRNASDWYERAFAEAAHAHAHTGAIIASRADWSKYYYKAACAWALSGDTRAAARNLAKALDAGSDRSRLY